MYHYVRDLAHSRYPEIKGLDAGLFKEQILYLKNHYSFITVEQLIDSHITGSKLPEKAVLLTFDDAYIDHFTTVFPILSENNIQGAFFPPVKAITEHIVLDVNKIHFILAAESNKQKIITEINQELARHRDEYSLQSNEYYYEKLAQPSRFDMAEVIFIKRLLQVELDEVLRKIITNHLFEKIVGIDEKSFSRELYMNTEQLKCMLRNGMHIGSHSFDHYWLNSLSYHKQKEEIGLSVDFLKSIGVDENYFTLCFPYGAYNEDTLRVMAEFNFKAGFSSKVDIAVCTEETIFHLPRLDTNDIPKSSHSEVNEWYAKG